MEGDFWFSFFFFYSLWLVCYKYTFHVHTCVSGGGGVWGCSKQLYYKIKLHRPQYGSSCQIPQLSTYLQNHHEPFSEPFPLFLLSCGSHFFLFLPFLFSLCAFLPLLFTVTLSLPSSLLSPSLLSLPPFLALSSTLSFSLPLFPSLTILELRLYIVL